MNWKKLGKALLYPHVAILILLIPLSAVMITFSLIFFGANAIVTYCSYTLSAYTLIVLCFRIPNFIRFCKKLKNENKYLKRYFSDPHLRVNISLYGSFIWNVSYAVFQLGLGFYHKSFWFYSMAIYYIVLSVMRFFLLKYNRKHKAGEQEQSEIKRYTICGWLMLIINLALSVMIFFMVYWNRTFYHHEITTITMATYTFVTFTVAIISIVRYKKYNSSIYSAAKSISLVAASVSMLTLETTMLTTFGESNLLVFRQVMLGCTGAVVSVFTIVMAVIMIVKGSKKLKALKNISSSSE